jgi:hypothetical protein
LSSFALRPLFERSPAKSTSGRGRLARVKGS